MRLSSSFVASSAIVVVSAVLLSGPAVSQVPTGSAATLPPVTVDAPKPAARPHRVERGTDTRTSHRTSSTTRVSTSAARTASPAPDTVLGRIAKYEKVASNCNGGRPIKRHITDGPLEKKAPFLCGQHDDTGFSRRRLSNSLHRGRNIRHDLVGRAS